MESPLEQLKRDKKLATALVELDRKHEVLLKSVDTIKGLMEQSKREVARVLNLPKGAKGDKGDIGPRGLTGKDGKNGVDGKDGFLPVKGKDYFTKADKEEVLRETLARIRQPKDGENAVVDQEKIAELAVALIREKKLLGIADVNGVSEEMSSYRHQMAMRQAGQHGGGDTVVAGTNILITSNSNGTKTISATGMGTGSVTSVSVVTANGISGSVANPTTTPAITLTLGDITPNSVIAQDAIQSNTAFILQETNGFGDLITIEAPASLTDSYSLTLPSDAGTNGYVLSTDGAGILSWISVGGGGNVSNTGTPLDNQIAVWTNATTIEGTSGLTYNGSNFQLTGDIGSTGTRITKGWFTDLQVTNAIAGSITGNAATVTIADAAGDTTTFPMLATSATGSLQPTTSANLSFNATTGALTATSFVGALTGNADTVTVANEATDTTCFINFTTAASGSLGIKTNANLTFNSNTGVLTSASSVLTTTDINGGTIDGTSIGASTPASAVVTTLTSQTHLPATDGTYDLGSTTLGWNNLHLDTGATINIENSNWLATHTSGILTVGTGDLRVTNAGTNSASVVTVGGTQILTAKTLTSPAITTGTYTGAQVLAESASIQLDPSLSADGTWTGVTMTGTAGYTQAFGDLVYLDPTDSRWEAADANSASGADGDARGLLAMVVVAGTDGNSCTLLLQGNIRADAKFATFTVNNPIYVSETAGAITQTQPTTTDVVIRVVGAALTADSIYFNPDFFYITHT